MGVAAVLADEVLLVAADCGARERRAPVRTNRLRVLRLYPDTVELLPYRGLDGHICRGIDRISRTTEKRSCESAIRRKVECRAPLSNHLACVSGNETQFARLPLDL